MPAIVALILRRLPLVFFGFLWIDLIHRLSFHWRSSPQYEFGWFVPVLALGLFGRRWAARPKSLDGDAASPIARSPGLPVLVALLCATLLPIRLAHEINADWAACSWLLALNVVGLTLAVLYKTGGRVWVRHFAFPAGFILVSVAWPYQLERGLTQGLMKVVANLTVEVLGWFEIPAVQRGNLIEVATGVVGIDEACSGIRSFQSTLMAALFLGEYFLLNWGRRSALVAGGVVVAFALNVCRTSLLAWKASSQGVAVILKWHDPAGVAVFCLSFAGLALMARRLARRREIAPSAAADSGHQMPAGLLVGVGCWSLAVVLATEMWYRAHERAPSTGFQWTARLPTQNPTCREIHLPATTWSKIGCDAGCSGTWTDGAGVVWSMHFFRWNPTSIEAVLRARIHRPEECLSAAGMRMTASPGVIEVDAGGVVVPFREYTFEADGRAMQVFFCQWEDGNSKQTGMWSTKLGDRIRSVLVGRRRLGQQTLEIAMSGSLTLAQAAGALKEELPNLVSAKALEESGGTPAVRAN